MKKILLQYIKRIVKRVVLSSIPEINYIDRIHGKGNEYNLLSWVINGDVSKKAKLYPIYHISDSTIGDYTYISRNSNISMTEIGKFCSIGPNFLCGWGIHPLNGISTSPMFYSTMKQNGITFSLVDKVEERNPIKIGNDVFIGANVTILDGVTIGDGAVIGAGAVVSKDIPPYAIAVGCPIRILRYRFDEEVRKKLLSIKWWNFDKEKLMDIEKYFFDINRFIEEYGPK
jgi:acetyltransferase-like isoleucine patch superfamily enzyme